MVVTSCMAPYVRWILNSEKKAVCTISDTIHGASEIYIELGNRSSGTIFGGQQSDPVPEPGTFLFAGPI